MVWTTHTVFNQPKPLGNSNLFLSDTPLREALQREQGGWDAEVLASLGQQLGTQESLELGRLANANPPELLRYDATGQRLDDVRFHPAWHILMQGLIANRVHNLPWQEDARIGSFVARAARFMLHAQVEAGTLCPVTMTFGATPLLLQALPAEFRSWLTPLLSDRYDAHLLPGGQKRGLLIGMGMTEKQGGSDVLSNTTTATPLGARGPGEAYRLVGHKWFFSVPQSDAHLVLAQAEGGLSCFFLPRILPDGSRNAIRLERLGIVKAYSTRVGAGPFPTELFDETGEYLCKQGNEFGATTGRRRRTGWLDAVAVRRAVQINSLSGFCLTKLDVLDGLKEVKICVGYRMPDGREVDTTPLAAEGWEGIEPIYEIMPGWSETTFGVKEHSKLPQAALNYIKRIEEVTGVPVDIISTGPDRSETMILRDPFDA